MVEGFQSLDQELGSRADCLGFKVQDLKLSSLNPYIFPLFQFHWIFCLILHYRRITYLNRNSLTASQSDVLQVHSQRVRVYGFKVSGEPRVQIRQVKGFDCFTYFGP